MTFHTDDGATPFSWGGIIQRIMIAAIGALIVGLGSFVISTVRSSENHETRIKTVEDGLTGLRELNTHVVELNGQIAVLNTKLEDFRKYGDTGPRK